MRSPAPLRALAAAGVLALTAAGCAGGGSAGPPGGDSPVAVVSGAEDTDGFAGALLDAPYTLPDLTFTDTGGAAYDLAADSDAPVTVVFFGYTSCPDVCSVVLADAASALRRAEPQVRERTQVVFVTTDPARDTPEVIRDYLDRFDPSFVGLTAELPVIEEAAAALGVALTGMEQLPSGGYEVGHGAQLVGFGPGRETTVVWTPGFTVGGLREDLTRLAGQA